MIHQLPFSADSRLSGLTLMFLLLGTQWVLPHALSINTRQKQRSESCDSAKVHLLVVESSSAQGGDWRKGGRERDVSCAASKVVQHTGPTPQCHDDFVGAKALGVKLFSCVDELTLVK